MTEPAPRAAPARHGLHLALPVALLVGYALLVYHGVGPPPEGRATTWWQPRAFLFDWSVSAALLESPVAALPLLGFPALAGAVFTFRATRSAVLRCLAVTCVLTVLLFTYYGVAAPFVWEFFRWRGSAAMVVLALVVGATATAPLLAGSWLRRGWPLRLALYAPIAFAVIAVERNATGTNPALSFGISPWPVVSVFGIEIAASILTAIYAGFALALFIYAAAFRREDGGVSRRRARSIALGAALAGLPLAAGQALANADYRATREGSALELIAALSAYYEREQIYPEDLEELIRTGDLDAIPRPRVGFRFLSDAHFEYQNFGTSYILEFPATRWVQCAYNPPWTDEDEPLGDAPETQAEAEADADEDAGHLEEAWSCPARPPELW